MKNKNSTSKAAIMIAVLSGMQLCLSSLSFAQPVSWTSYYNAGDNSYSFGQVLPTVNLKSIAYNPINNEVYVYGPAWFNLPAQPSGNVYTKEVGIKHYDNTGIETGSVFDVHHDGTTMIPRYDEAGEMAIASDGSVYVTGKRYYDDFYLYDMVIIKYNSALVEQWRNYLYSPGTANDSGVAITIEPGTNNVIVAGQLGDNGTGTGLDFITAKFSPAGGLLWQKVYNTGGTQDDYPTDVTADASGNIYVAGYSVSPTKGNQYTLIRYTSVGAKKWTKYYNGVSGSLADDKAYSVATDNISGNIYITGTSENASANTDIATVAYDIAGTKLWAKRINNPGDSRDRGSVVKVDASQNIYVGGDVDRDASSGISGDLIYRKYDASGVVLRTKKYNGSGYNCEFGDLAITSGGTAYMTGWCLGAVIPPSNGSYSLMTVKYNASGVFQWSDFLTPGQFQTCGEGDYGFKLALNTATSEAAVGGRRWSFCPGSHPNEWLTRRYSPTLRETENSSQDEIAVSLNANIYPDPVKDNLTIEINQPCSIIIQNINGQLVYEGLADGNTVNINSSRWSAGIYSVVLRNKEEVLVKKIIKQ